MTGRTLSFSRRPSTTLSRSTLLKMGVRIAGVVALATLFSYLHVLHSVRTENRARLERYVVERSQREQGIFLLAQGNHAILQKALEERLRALEREEVGARFDNLCVQLSDGSIRDRPELFDGRRMPGVIVPRGRLLDAGVRRRILAAYDVLEGPGWNFVTVLPESVVSEPALQAARQVLLVGMVALLLELAIMSLVLKRQITRPLLAFTQAADRVAAGDFRGEERTRELKDVHRQLVQSARRAGMAEVATNVLHNVGNVLNSVYTSAQIARERVGQMRLEAEVRPDAPGARARAPGGAGGGSAAHRRRRALPPPGEGGAAPRPSSPTSTRC